MLSILAEDADTIAAISTASGEAAISLVRISGSKALKIGSLIFRSQSNRRYDDFVPRKVYLGQIVDEGGKPIDQVLLTCFKRPKSYTREDIIEISTHGGYIASRKIFELILRSGARAANRGEFSKRAFLNGRIDLIELESIIDLVKSRSEKDFERAVSNLVDGRLQTELKELESLFADLVGKLELAIDFPEEEISIPDRESIKKNFSSLHRRIDLLIKSYSRGRGYREGFNLAIIGRPNSGKSSLLNKLLERDRAIVTDIPGTTRDSIEEFIEIGGVPFTLIDTAGIRESLDIVELEGIRRSINYIEKGDILLVLFDSSEELSSDDHKILDMLRSSVGKKIFLLSKSDLEMKIDSNYLINLNLTNHILPLSIKDEKSIDRLKDQIEKLSVGDKLPDSVPLLNRSRHIDIIGSVLSSLDKAIDSFDRSLSEEFVISDLLEAKRGIGKLFGKDINDEALAHIFEQFCIGK